MKRKVFRIEQTLTASRRVAVANGFATHAKAASQSGSRPCLKRTAGELGAAVEDMEQAVQVILQSAEAIEERAKVLAQASRGDRDGTALIEEVQHHLTRIYEACNFQDIAGQRIAKVIETLSAVDQHASSANGNGHDPSARHPARVNPLLNGPRLDGEAGRVNQFDVDAMFR